MTRQLVRALSLFLTTLLAAACSDFPVDPKREPNWMKTVPGASDKPAAAPRASEPERPLVRIIAHPQNPMILYITDVPSREQGSFLGLPLPPRESIRGKLFVVNVSTGQWRELNLGSEAAKKFQIAERFLLTFDVGGEKGAAAQAAR